MFNFIEIKTFYNSKDERTFEKLKDVYSNSKLLIQVIENITQKYFTYDKIANKRVFIKPNWVLHNRKEYHEYCMRTNENFIIATLEVILKKKPISVLIADAPVQGCNWTRMHKQSFFDKIKKMSINFNVPVNIKDLRRISFDTQNNKLEVEINPLTEYCIFNLGKESYLEPVSYNSKSKFRVTDYDPDRLSESHGPGNHKYCITKEIFNTDVIINLPKIKTHQKAGITNALKNLVGLNGDKDFLPHHRIGSANDGGDCYPNYNILRNFSEKILDSANRIRGKKGYLTLRRVSALLWSLSMPKHDTNIEAGWFGNDTTWRMVLDLNKIAKFGKADGTISKEKQREIFSLCDGIIAGQRNGPLDPEPLELGIICFTNNSVLADFAIANLMGFDSEKIALLSNSKSEIDLINSAILINNKKALLSDLKKYQIKTVPPDGWLNYL